jgi:hypothetical protein
VRYLRIELGESSVHSSRGVGVVGAMFSVVKFDETIRTEVYLHPSRHNPQRMAEHFPEIAIIDIDPEKVHFPRANH